MRGASSPELEAVPGMRAPAGKVVFGHGRELYREFRRILPPMSIQTRGRPSSAGANACRRQSSPTPISPPSSTPATSGSPRAPASASAGFRTSRWANSCTWPRRAPWPAPAWTARQIELIVAGTTSYDDQVPNVASGIQRRIGAEGCAAMDVNTACTSFLYSLSTATAMISTGVVRNALVHRRRGHLAVHRLDAIATPRCCSATAPRPSCCRPPTTRKACWPSGSAATANRARSCACTAWAPPTRTRTASSARPSGSSKARRSSRRPCTAWPWPAGKRWRRSARPPTTSIS